VTISAAATKPSGPTSGTPVIRADLSELDTAGPALPAATLKLEQLQRAGSFKARGAFANLLLRDVPAAA